MKVLLVRPKPSPETIGLQHLMIVEPLELEILATLIKNIHSVQIVDMILEKRKLEHFLEHFKPNVVGFTGYITHIPVIIQNCQKVKLFNKDVVTVVGGVHVEIFPEDIDDASIDYRVVRNATRAFPQLMNFLTGKANFPSGVLKKKERIKDHKVPDYDFFIPVPDRTLTAQYRNKYFYVLHNKVALIKTSFGCPYNCRFCFCRLITGKKYAERPLKEVMYELTTIKEKDIYIVDDDFMINIDRVKEFIRMSTDLNLEKQYLVYGRADFIASNPQLLKELKQIGLRTVIVGLESFKDEELSAYKKQINSKINKQALLILKDLKIDCYASVIVSPSWDHKDFKIAGDIMIDLGIKFVNLQPLTPLKGTGVVVKDENLLINRKDFTKWDLAHVTIKPEKMTEEEFYRNILRLYYRILLRPQNLYSLLAYPLYMNIKLAKGIVKVSRQYKLYKS